MPWRDLDQSLSAIADLVEGFADIEAQAAEMGDGAVQLSAISLSTPVELGMVLNEDGRVHLGMAPPTQHIETTFLPVFHQLRMRIVAVEAPDGDQ